MVLFDFSIIAEKLVSFDRTEIGYWKKKKQKNKEKIPNSLNMLKAKTALSFIIQFLVFLYQSFNQVIKVDNLFLRKEGRGVEF